MKSMLVSNLAQVGHSRETAQLQAATPEVYDV